MQVIAEVDLVRLVDNRHGMKEIVRITEVDPVHVYRKLVFKCIVFQLVGVVVRISEKLITVRFLTLTRIHSAHQRFRHVG